MFVHFVLLAIEALAQNWVFLLLNSYLSFYTHIVSQHTCDQFYNPKLVNQKLRNFVKLLSQKGLQNDFMLDLSPL